VGKTMGHEIEYFVGAQNSLLKAIVLKNRNMTTTTQCKICGANEDT
jgi:hypothetical protein